MLQDQISTMLEKLDIQLKSDEKDLEGKALLKVIMRKFLPAGDSLLFATSFSLSPVRSLT